MAVAMCGLLAVVSISPGMPLDPFDTDPNRLMPLRTPLKKSPFSFDGWAASASLLVSLLGFKEEKAAENFDSSDALVRNVSLSAMTVQ